MFVKKIIIILFFNWLQKKNLAFSLYFEKKISALLRGLILKSTHTQKQKFHMSSVVCWFLTLYKVNALHYKRTLIFQTLVNLVARTRTTVPEYKRTVHEKYFRECDWRNNSSHSSGSLCCEVSLISLRFPGAVTFIWFSVSLLILCYCHLNKVSLWFWLPGFHSRLQRCTRSTPALKLHSILYSHLSGHGERAGRPHLVYTVHC